MKTKILFLGAMVTAFTYTSFAGDVFLSPRAKDNQIKVVTSSISTQGGAVTYITPASPAVLSPRAKDNQFKVVKGVDNDFNPYLACQKMMTGSPKAVQACANNPAMPICTGKPVTVAPLH